MQAPQTLDYLRNAPDDREPINVPAVLSIASAGGAIIFALSVFAGIWRQIWIPLHEGAGWVVLILAISSVVWGGIGALRADRESRWYTASLIGYAGGMMAGTFSPALFML